MTRSGIRLVTLAALATGAVIAAAGCGADRESAPGDASAMVVTSHGDVSLDWETDWSEAFSRARSENKVVLASFNADWCVWCRRLETTTYQDAKVASMLGERTVPLSLDVEGNGKQLSDDHGVDGLPTVVVFAADGRELGRIDGYVAPDGFLELMSGILSRS